MKLIKIAAMMICALMLFSCAPASPGVDHDADENGKTTNQQEDNGKLVNSTVKGEPSGWLDIKGEPLDNGEVSDEFTSATNAFALALLENLDDDWTGVYSPASLAMVLQLTMQGADEKARAAMAEALHIDMTNDDINVSNSRLLSALGSKGINMANAVMVSSEYALNGNFAAIAANFYRAETGTFDFTDGRSVVDSANKWVSDHTNGRIKQLFETLPKDTLMLLINALDLDLNWKTSFDAEKVYKDLDFHGTNGDQKVTLMAAKGEFLCAEIDGGKVILLPYENDECFMAVALPPEGVSPNVYLGKVMGRWNECKAREAELWLPKIELNSRLELLETLRAMGMGEALLGGSGNFPGLLDADEFIQIGDVIQAAHINVNENGTQAAAGSGVAMKRGISLEDKFVVRCDRPYAMVIVHTATNETLFVATVNNIE